MVESRHKSQRGKGSETVSSKQQPGANTKKDNPDVFDTGEGQQRLQVIFHQRVQNSKKRRDCSNHQNDRAPPCRSLTEPFKRNADETVDTEFNHHTRHHRRNMTRRGRMGARQPNVEWNSTGLAEKTGGHHKKNKASHSHVNPACPTCPACPACPTCPTCPTCPFRHVEGSRCLRHGKETNQ